MKEKNLDAFFDLFGINMEEIDSLARKVYSLEGMPPTELRLPQIKVMTSVGELICVFANTQIPELFIPRKAT